MDNFAAIDFETANNERTSICSVGVVIVRNGEIADRFYSLVHPEPDYYLYWNTRIHGLTQEDTAHAPVFSEVWKQVAPKIEGLPLVAHNKAFDEGCLKAVFRTYCMDYPDRYNKSHNQDNPYNKYGTRLSNTPHQRLCYAQPAEALLF